jgi:hypothetical protein
MLLMNKKIVFSFLQQDDDTLAVVQLLRTWQVQTLQH